MSPKQIDDTDRAFPSWLTLKPEGSLGFGLRTRLAGLGLGLSSNERKIASLKDRHAGEVGFLIGNGPSVRIEDLDRLQNSVTFCCNRFYLAYDRMRFRPTYLCSTDRQMIRDFGAEMARHNPGRTLLISEEKPDIAGDYVWFRQKSRTPLEFSENAYDFIMPGGGTLIAAAQIAYHMGMTRLYLYGIDHSFTYDTNKDAKDVWEKASGDGNHFIENYRAGKPWAPPVLWQFEGALLSCHVFMQAKGGWIKNATRGGKLEVLERIEFDEIALD